ncbi:MAG: hypothetical protein KKB50_02855 [Planctomycetes bacterium]|nr:hypothetical protein [Planctomycetota bacterium]
MKRAVCLLLSLSLAAALADAQEKQEEKKVKKPAAEQKTCALTDPVEILKKVDAACKAVKVVKYDVVYEAEASRRTVGTKLAATMTITGYTDRFPEKFLIDVKQGEPRSEEVQHITGGADGETYYVIDHAAKKAYEDLDPQVFGSFARLLAGGLMLEFVHPTPFSDEINGRVQELKGGKVINGEDCYEVYVVYAADTGQTATWYFSKKDFLPRGRIDEFVTPDGGKVRQKKILAHLVADPKLDKDAFKLKLPEGYTKTDDFAP